MLAVTAYIGLGSNLAEPVAQVRAGMDSLASLPQTQVEARSSFYASAPVGITAQPDFVNAACRVRTGLSARTLMQALLDIEKQQGRVRGDVKGGPRTLDLDLLLYGAEILNESDLVVPHPRLHERAFVLHPLCELDAQLVVPGRGRVADLLAACRGQRVERLAGS
jgi:2-amino-4-hydroxy-6-hydroxymethyldihydropteridine diphosphokinase